MVRYRLEEQMQGLIKAAETELIRIGAIMANDGGDGGGDSAYGSLSHDKWTKEWARLGFWATLSTLKQDNPACHRHALAPTAPTTEGGPGCQGPRQHQGSPQTLGICHSGDTLGRVSAFDPGCNLILRGCCSSGAGIGVKREITWR